MREKRWKIYNCIQFITKLHVIQSTWSVRFCYLYYLAEYRSCAVVWICLAYCMTGTFRYLHKFITILVTPYYTHGSSKTKPMADVSDFRTIFWLNYLVCKNTYGYNIQIPIRVIRFLIKRKELHTISKCEKPSFRILRSCYHFSDNELMGSAFAILYF